MLISASGTAVCTVLPWQTDIQYRKGAATFSDPTFPRPPLFSDAEMKLEDLPEARDQVQVSSPSQCNFTLSQHFLSVFCLSPSLFAIRRATLEICRWCQSVQRLETWHWVRRGLNVKFKGRGDTNACNARMGTWVQISTMEVKSQVGWCASLMPAPGRQRTGSLGLPVELVSSRSGERPHLKSNSRGWLDINFWFPRIWTNTWGHTSTIQRTHTEKENELPNQPMCVKFRKQCKEGPGRPLSIWSGKPYSPRPSTASEHRETEIML